MNTYVCPIAIAGIVAATTFPFTEPCTLATLRPDAKVTKLPAGMAEAAVKVYCEPATAAQAVLKGRAQFEPELDPDVSVWEG